MKFIDFKTLMVLSFLITSMAALPVMALGQDNSGSSDEEYKDSEQYGAFENFQGGFGGVFSKNLGPGGEILGTLFEMLLLDGVDFKDDQKLEGIYVLSADKEEVYTGNYSFAQNMDTQEIHYLPFYNSTGGTANQYRIDSLEGYAYCVVEKEGGFEYNLTIGAALTLIIMDYDGSFIEAAEKVLDWAVRFREAEKKDKINQKIVAEGVQVLSWLLVHINDIFTGDELFVFNPIVWQSLEMEPWPDFNIKKTWYDSGFNNGIEYGAGDDTDLTGDPLLTEWNISAALTRDSYMQWLLTDFDAADLAETIWTQFSFDLAQLWVKEFYVELDLSVLSHGKHADIDDMLERADVEFYLFTHHLAGAFLYYDSDKSGDMTVKYDYARNETGDIIYTNGTAAMIPTSNEVTHRLILGTVEDFDFKVPEVDKEDDSVSWGLLLKNANMSAVPVGVDLNSYVNAPEEELAYIYFGLEFQSETDKHKNGEIEQAAHVKLETNFAPWNDNDNPYPNQEIDDLDMAIIYLSSILHFDLHIEKGDKVEPEENEDFTDQSYSSSSHTLKVGDYLNEDNKDKLDFVDIAGPGYLLGNSTNRDRYAVNTSIIPIALWEGEEHRSETDVENKDNTDDDFEADVDAVAQWNIILYAVCYPDFNGTGNGIWHDPTFSVYMVFTPEEPSFWALILLISGVGLAGVATILIKRRKDKW
ncbi:MAG: hypothetical protein ACFFDK_14935 [Promethearchaeota archaeon]